MAFYHGFLAASEKLDGFRGDSSPKTWLYSILNFKIIDHYRAKVKQPVKLGNQSLSNFFTGDGEWIQQKRPKSWHVKFVRNWILLRLISGK